MVGNTYVRFPCFPNLPTHAAPAAVQGRGLEEGYQSSICLRNVSPNSFTIYIYSSSWTSDAFALNIGRDDWMPARVSDAYSAAKALNSTFKLFISFDMSYVVITLLSLKLNDTQVYRVHNAARHLIATGIYYPLRRAPEPVHLQRKAICVDLCWRKLFLWWQLQVSVECIQEKPGWKCELRTLFPCDACLIEGTGTLCPFVLH
jgi:hypothetical protein